MSGRTSINGMPKCFAASRPIGSYLQVDDRTTFAPVVSQSFKSLASSFWSTMYGNLRGLGVRLQLRTPSISRKITFIRDRHVRTSLREPNFSTLKNRARRSDDPGSVSLARFDFKDDRDLPHEVLSFCANAEGRVYS